VTTADDNVAVGRLALFNNTASGNTAVGMRAADANTSGVRNAALGADALCASVTATDQTAIGYNALLVATAGGNTFVGSRAGDTITTGANNTGVGAGVDTDAAARTGSIAIGVSAAGTAALATVDDGLFFHNALAVVAGTAVEYDGATGQMGPIASSRRFKENVSSLADGAIDSAKVYDLREVAYTLKTNGAREFGLIAEEVAEVYPEIVPLDAERRPQAVKYDRLTVLLLAELRKLRDRVAQLEAR